MRRLIVILLFAVVFTSLIESPIEAFDTEGHTSITTEALSFLRPEILNQVIGGNAGIFDYTTQSSPEIHFDGCYFADGYRYINSQYGLLPGMALEMDIRAPGEFGHILHAAQDFYAHSNYVENGSTYIVEDSYDLWNNNQPVIPYGLTDGRMFIEGEPPDGFELTLDKRTKTVMVTDTINQETYIGILSGAAYTQGNCPANALIGHWDLSATAIDDVPGGVYYGDGLNKDNQDRLGYQEAYDLAVQQTQHEWCRLLYLVAKDIGPEKTTRFLQSWLHQEMKVKHCLTANHLL